jgi:hypothetical protein
MFAMLSGHGKVHQKSPRQILHSWCIHKQQGVEIIQAVVMLSSPKPLPQRTEHRVPRVFCRPWVENKYCDDSSDLHFCVVSIGRILAMVGSELSFGVGGLSS